MKKLISLLLFFIFLGLCGCSAASVKNTITGTKPNTYYYSNLLAKDINKTGITEMKILETNLQKEKVVGKDDIDTLLNFLSLLKFKDFKESVDNLPQKPQYKIYVTANSNKYILNIYNEKYISVFPWDGIYKMDYIDMSNTKNLYNLFYLCKYIYKD